MNNCKYLLAHHGFLTDYKNNKVNSYFNKMGVSVAQNIRDIPGDLSFSIYAHSAGTMQALKTAVRNYRKVNKVVLIAPVGIFYTRKPHIITYKYLLESIYEWQRKTRKDSDQIGLRVLKRFIKIITNFVPLFKTMIKALAFDAKPYLKFLNKKNIPIFIILNSHDKLFGPNKKVIRKLQKNQNVKIKIVKGNHAIHSNSPSLKQASLYLTS